MGLMIIYYSLTALGTIRQLVVPSYPQSKTYITVSFLLHPHTHPEDANEMFGRKVAKCFTYDANKL
jgi:hypothetical protein